MRYIKDYKQLAHLTGVARAGNNNLKYIENQCQMNLCI